MLRQKERGTPPVDERRQLGGSKASFYIWKKRYCNLGIAEVRELRPDAIVPRMRPNILLLCAHRHRFHLDHEPDLVARHGLVPGHSEIRASEHAYDADPAMLRN